MRRIFISVAIFACAGSVSAQVPNRIELACVGGGAANHATVSGFNAWGNDGSAAGGQVYGSRSVGFQDQVNMWLEGSEGRIRLPRTMLPPIHGGEDGWFKLKSIVMNDREITASAAVNVMNNPKVRIDRYTGAISISGKAGDFTGQCRKYDPATERRAF
ncbi:hypothetical protein [Novosphingobium aerophilum]|uniref:Uncharacterized protein n=1 Tax=Novosphingobium aerophilum TaxID=2839843 RepID=A0A7X1FAU7_9SPHN|nr:hypothetical protein [Novosphingobium aerophilum]MBC2653603.1 hypothetical protein [Novosphingobium aerophilum]